MFRGARGAGREGARGICPPQRTLDRVFGRRSVQHLQEDQVRSREQHALLSRIYTQSKRGTAAAATTSRQLRKRENAIVSCIVPFASFSPHRAALISSCSLFFSLPFPVLFPFPLLLSFLLSPSLSSSFLHSSHLVCPGPLVVNVDQGRVSHDVEAPAQRVVHVAVHLAQVDLQRQGAAGGRDRFVRGLN